jgi:glycosyltransferase involved in cell wall biosynthesis
LLALVESPDHVCCRYRIRAFAPALQQAGWSLSCQRLEKGTWSRTFQLCRAARFDAVVLQRKLLPVWQLRVLRRSARHLVFDFDDAVLYRDSNDPRGPQSRRRLRRFTETVRLVDTIVAGNDFLADCALRAGAPVDRVHVIPTCVDPGLYPMARHEPSTGPADLVWIGSSSTLKGLDQARPIWERLAQADPRLRLRVICDRFPRDFPLPIVPIPWVEASEARQLSAGQIGVSWLPDDLWSRGKCGLKVLQYQAAGLPVIANPVGCQAEMISSGQTGILAATPAEWLDAVTLLAGDPKLRRQMGQSGRRRVETDYSLAAWAQTFVTSMTGSSQAVTVTTGPTWKVDWPAPACGRARMEPHAGKLPQWSTLKPVGER